MELLFGILIILLAYFVKGFSGFGPALIIVPFFTLLYDRSSALVVAALFDFIAGCILVYTVRRAIDWKFALSVFLFLAIGAFFGALLLGEIPVGLLKKIIGAVLFVFATIILLQKNGQMVKSRERWQVLKYPAAFISGFLGGLVSMSGPPLIVYMKLMYEKSFFRTQLIAIFMFGTAWRYLLFVYHEIPMTIPFSRLAIYFICLLVGLWIGKHLHIRVNETVFNKTVAVILYIPVFNLLFY